MKNLEQQTDNELIKEYKILNDTIQNSDCFGVNDLLMREQIERELDKRGYDVTIKRKCKVTKRQKE